MNPREVLGVSAAADFEEIRAAYLKKVKEFPPDRSPAEFEKIRDAWEALKDPRQRLREMLAADPEASLFSLFDGFESERRFVGPAAWLDALKQK
jgi:curved DNA-binding protein CbpA